MKISRHCLRVENPQELVEFYSGILGMRDFGKPDEPLLGYDGDQCLLELTGGASSPYRSRPDGLYWKIGITVRDLDTAVAYLATRGCAVTAPRQFKDIGYMSHLHDPQGFAIELLQQGFEGRAGAPGDGHPIGGQATLAHITLRVNDINAARDYCENRLQMRLMSVQPVEDYGFCLYFFAWSDEALPEPDLKAVANREWLWARPYALLELQHVFSGHATEPEPGSSAAGFTGFGWIGGDMQAHQYVPLRDLKSLL
ncbi:VOC family protein [Hoeflea prorocentri]|uniref:VOC family protein n=1 Tax=Hoeflea prorocentri TaxID=1922333 RepID=A0A9X3UI35_9HYPH|nr:VOC family protein [Hoeflea prorocentri]MCY6381067.1 VOC family protein [Hoeflea prorocentri]MDA5398867.1 VOC family protein [Hoeflea prorocentri]